MRGREFGVFEGPGPGGMPALTMDNYEFNVKGQKMVAKDAFGHRLYDTFRVKAGTVIPTSPFIFFSIPLGQQQAGLNFTTQYVKTKQDTNLLQASQIEKGSLFRIISMQLRIVETGGTDTTYGSSGAGTELPTNPAGAAVVSAVNEEKAVLEASFYTFKVNNKEYEEGKGIHFPSPYGFSGFAGSGAPGGSGAGTDAISVVNNGFGRMYTFPVIRNIDGLRYFSVIGQFAYGITPNRNFQIECTLEGLKYRSVQ